MWEQAEFEKHWRNEFPEGEVPVMNLHSVEDIEVELEKCKTNLKVLQQALSEEKFKVIYLQTTIARKKKRCDIEKCWNKVDSKKNNTCDTDSRDEEPFARDILRVGRTGKPTPLPPRDISLCVAEQRSSERDSDHEFEDVELNVKFLQNNILNPKSNVRESHRLNPLARMSRDLDSDDGRLSPSLALRGSHGSGRSTPDGYLSSDHDDDSSAGRTSLTTKNSYHTSYHLQSPCLREECELPLFITYHNFWPIYARFTHTPFAVRMRSVFFSVPMLTG